MSSLSQCQRPAPISHNQLQLHIILRRFALGLLHVQGALLRAAIEHTADSSAAAGHCTVQILLQPICGLPSPLLRSTFDEGVYGREAVTTP